MRKRPSFAAPATLSIAIHLLAIPLLFKLAMLQETAPKNSIKIRLQKDQQKKQLVTPPQITEKIPPIETNKQSDNDSSTKTEQIKRGTEGSTVISKKKGKPIPPAPEPQTKTKNETKTRAKTKKEVSPKKIKTLTLPKSEIAKFTTKTTRKTPSSNQERKIETRPFSRPQGSGAAILGSRGIQDYLPDLPDGDITLLNAKANKYAVFVRRVAKRVFGHLRQSGWEKLSISNVQAIKDFSEIHAKIDLNGKLTSLILLSPSGSQRFDIVVQESVQSGAKDKNPPRDAANADGQIHFVFKSRSWVQRAVGRNGGPTQRRWILLGDGVALI